MPAIIDYPSPNQSERLPGSSIEYLIIHYTGCGLETSLKILTDAASNHPVSAHYVIGETGQIYQLVSEDRLAWHAGLSYWQNKERLNTWSIGIELINPGHGPLYTLFPKAQMESLLELSHQILIRHQIPLQHVLGHSDIAPGRKVDPGELFDWQWLAQNGVGLYPPLKTGLPENLEISETLTTQKLLRDIGYHIPISGVLDPHTLNVIKAFQMHFLPGSVDGKITQSLINRLHQIRQFFI